MRRSKKTISILLALFMVFALLPAVTPSARAEYKFSGEGDGTEDNPYVITNYYQLGDLELLISINDRNDVHAVLAQDIYIDGDSIIGIGHDYEPFIGMFDGQGYSIIGAKIHYGLFRYVGSGGVVRNVILKDCNVQGETRDEAVAGVAAYNFGTVENCSFIGNVRGYRNSSDGDYDGGVVGYNEGTVNNCSFSGSVSGKEYIGGVVGYNGDPGKVTNCYNAGSVNGINGIGGVTGYNSGVVTNCHNTGSVTSSSNVGGVAGENVNTLENCWSAGSVTGSEGESVGGVVGCNADNMEDHPIVENGCYDMSLAGSIGAIDGSDDETNNVVGKSSAEMTGMNASAYDGWTDFDKYWTLTESYPALRMLRSGISYIDPTDPDDPQKICDLCASVLSDMETPRLYWSDQNDWNGWYAVKGGMTVADRIEVTGAVNLILMDGTALNAQQGIHVGGGDSLTIWCQSGGTGTLTATGMDNYTGIGGGKYEDGGTIIINGGTVNASSDCIGAGIGGG